MATVWGPVSPTTSAISTAIAAASSGDTILVDSGEATWVGQVTVNKNLSIIGAGIGNTIVSKSSLSYVFDIGYTTSRISGFEFNSGQIVASGQGWRIDHCSFSEPLSSTAYAFKAIYATSALTGYQPIGLIDNCAFSNMGVLVTGNSNDLYGMSYIWYQALGLGTNNAVYIEDCTFQGLNLNNAIDANHAARYVFRHNTLTDAYIECHGIQGIMRAPRSWEIYDNTLQRGSGYAGWMGVITIRGGTGVIFNNTVIGTWGNYNARCYAERDCAPYGEAGEADGTSLWDGNANPPVTLAWPARDHTGQSTDAWLWTAGNPYPTQTLDPAYIWNCERSPSGTLVKMEINSATCAEGFINHAENRDFYNENASFDGTTGVGVGLKAARPATCTTGVGYWATDEEILYRATATNTWTAWYTPYTYPHPLQTEQDFEPIAGDTVTCSDTLAVQETKPPAYGAPSKFTRAFY
jgi:hypothetical protein